MKSQPTAPPKVFICSSHDSAEHKGWVPEFATTIRDRGVDAILKAQLALCALFLLSANAAEVTQYQLLGACPTSGSEDCLAYFDPSAAKLYEGMLTVNLVQDYSRPHSIDSNGSNRDYSSADVYMTFDCPNKLYQQVETIFRTGHFCTGDIAGSIRMAGAPDGKWKPFPTDSDDTISAILKKLQGACNNASIRSINSAIPAGDFSSW
jgi:hypothetical protein